jgi:lysozyme family protein
MADFNQYLPMLLRFEGGWVDNPADPGGATNLGITWRTFHIFAEKILKIAPTLQNLKRLTDEQAGKIYKTEYWDAIYGDDIEHQLLADMICDFYVNAGWHAITILLKVLNRNGANFHISMRITPKVIEVIN